MYLSCELEKKSATMTKEGIIQDYTISTIIGKELAFAILGHSRTSYLRSVITRLQEHVETCLL